MYTCNTHYVPAVQSRDLLHLAAIDVGAHDGVGVRFRPIQRMFAALRVAGRVQRDGIQPNVRRTIDQQDFVHRGPGGVDFHV